LWAGSIRLRGLSWSPIGARETEVVQPQRIGGHSVFKSERVLLDASLWRVVTGMHRAVRHAMLLVRAATAQRMLAQAAPSRCC
jgi:hypothetical protein